MQRLRNLLGAILLTVFALEGCSRSPINTYTVMNLSGSELINLVVIGTSSRERIGRLEPSAAIGNGAPRQEAVLGIAFDVNGRHVESLVKPELVDNGGCTVEFIVLPDLTIEQSTSNKNCEGR